MAVEGAFMFADAALKTIQETLAYDQLSKAIDYGSLIEVKEILQNYSKFETICDKKGNLPLHWAANCKHFEVFEHLISNYPGTAVIPNLNDETPLYTAIMNDNFNAVMKLEDIASLLKEKGISLCQGQRTSSQAETSKQGEEKQRPAKSLVHAILSQNRDNWIDEVGVLFKHEKMLMESVDERGLLPLSWMIQNPADKSGGMAIKLAEAHPKLIKVQDMDNSDKSFPIHRALMAGKFEVIKAFYQVDKTSIDLKDRFKRDIFNLAASKDYYQPEFHNLFEKFKEVKQNLDKTEKENHAPIKIGNDMQKKKK